MGSPPSLVTILLFTRHGLNTSKCPPPFFSAADHRPLLQCSLPHIDLRLPGQIVRRGKGKHMVWRSEHKAAFVTHMLETRQSYNIFGTLYAIKSINLATNSSWISLHMLLMPLV